MQRSPLFIGSCPLGDFRHSEESQAVHECRGRAQPNERESALLLTLQPGAYTAQITSAKGNSGIALFEAYTD